MARKLIALALLALSSSLVMASCPKDQPYRCYQGANGKQVCGCGY